MIAHGATLVRAPADGSFAALMELYEANYSRLRLLLPELSAMADNAVSQVPDCIGLYAQVIERCPYTTTLRLHYAFSGQPTEHKAPYLKIRIYHDARAAEAMTGLIQHGDGVDFTQSLQTRWRRNRFLYKWLGYCLRRGHRFHARTAPGLGWETPLTA